MFQLFKKANPEIKTEAKDNVFEISPEDNTLMLCVDKNGELTVKISIQNLETKNAAKFAEVLFLVEQKGYREMFMQMLQDMAAEDKSRQDFISDVMLYWTAYIDTYKNMTYNKDGPVVSPTKFSQLVNNSERQ